MKRIISLFMASLLVFSLSLPAYAATSDDLANKLYSGWSDTSTPLRGSWYDLIKQYFSHLNSKIDLWLPYLKNLGSSTDGDNAYTLVGTSKFLHNILGNNLNGNISTQLYNIRTLLTTISSSSSAWTSSQASTVTNNTSLINSVLSSISDKLIHIEPIYNNSVTIDSNVSDLTNSLVKSTFDVTNMNDSNFGNSTWYSGVYGILYRLQQVLADDEDLQMRKDTEENRNSFKQNFLDSSANNSVKVSDISSLSSLSTDLKNLFNTGVSPSSLFNFLNDPDDNSPFLWFTPYCQSNMVTVPKSSSYSLRVRSSSSCFDYVTPRMNDYYNAIEEVK